MPPPPLPLYTKEVQDDKESLEDAEEYLRDSGVAFNDQDDDQRIYEQARRSRGRGRGRGQSRDQSRRREAYISPPPSAPPSIPSPFLVAYPSSLPQSPRSTQSDRSYSELFAAFQRQQEVIARLRKETEERARNEDSLRADSLAMTHRYLQAQATIDTLERRCMNAEGRAARLTFHEQLEERKGMAGDDVIFNQSPETSSPGMWSIAERDRLQEKRNEDRGDTATISAGTVDSSEYVSVDLSSSSSLNLRPSIPSEEVLKLVRTINLQLHEVARACIASANVKPGVRNIQADNNMVVDLTEGIGCILVQMLRSRDHSKNKSIVELCFRALLSYHVSKLVEDWPFHAQGKRKYEQSSEEDSEQHPNMDKEFGEGVDNALRDIATVLSLSGSPGDPTSLVRNHRDRIGSTLNTLLKTAENLANQVKGGRFEGSSSAEYSFLFARPGATFNKDLMQKHNSQQSMAIWKSAPKKPVQVLCTREVGLARLHRIYASRSAGSMSRTNLHSGGRSQESSSHVKEIEVLTKVIVVFESDIDK